MPVCLVSLSVCLSVCARFAKGGFKLFSNRNSGTFFFFFFDQLCWF